MDADQTQGWSFADTIRRKSMRKGLKTGMAMVAIAAFFTLSGCGKRETIYEVDNR